jgi:MAF protein
MSSTADPKLFRLLRPLVLASNSPRRKDFLRAMGIACRVVSPPEDAEPLPLPGEVAEKFAARAAKAKADAVYTLLGEKDAVVLGADTVVFRDGKMLGKPQDMDAALAFLHTLAGGAHSVRTACFLRLGESGGVSFYGEARVSMGAWPKAVLKAYAASGEGLDKAGAYAVQGLGAFLVESVSGSWSSVVGLPAAETVAVLLEHGIIEAVG